MGAYLSKPNLHKVEEEVEGEGLSIGWRLNQEDAHCCHLHITPKNADEIKCNGSNDNSKKPDMALFGVFDGHGGSEVARYVADIIADRLVVNGKFGEDIESALSETFLAIDAEVATFPATEKLAELATVAEEEDEKAVSHLKELDNNNPLQQSARKALNKVLAGKDLDSSDDGGSSEEGLLNDEEEDEEDEKENSMIEKSGSQSPPPSKKSKSGAGDSSANNDTDQSEVKKENGHATPLYAESQPQRKKFDPKSLLEENGETGEPPIAKTESIDDEDDAEPDANKSNNNETKTEEAGKGGFENRKSKLEKELTKAEEAHEDFDKKDGSGDHEETSIVNGEVVTWRNAHEVIEELVDDTDSEWEDVPEEKSGTGSILQKFSALKAFFHGGGGRQFDSDEPEKNTTWRQQLKKPFTLPRHPGHESGTTAVVAALRHSDDTLFVANAGDSRAVLCRNGKAIDLSIDHKPEDEIELDRITKAGGSVIDGRVNSGLNLSRAIGDHQYKVTPNLPGGLADQMISAKPDIKSVKINRSTDPFLILACDGIWNSMDSQEVVDFVVEHLEKHKDLPPTKRSLAVCSDIFDHCVSPDAEGDGTGCDNMTAILILIDHKKGR